MESTLADLFIEAGGTVIDWRGSPVYAAYEIDKTPSEFFVRFISAKEAPTQGLRLRARGFELEVNGDKGSDFLLWSDTSPQETTVIVTRTTGAVSLKVWNIWRAGFDVVQAWLGNAAMRLNWQGEELLELQCSDGVGQVCFEDLRLQLVFLKN